MKILHVINSLSMGGAEKLVADLAPLQRERGHDVEVLLFRGGESAFRAGLESAGIQVYDFGTGTSVYSPLNVLRLIPFMRKYDVIHVHLFPAQYYVALAKLLSFSKACLVTTEHSTHNRRRDISFFRYFDKWAYRRFTKIVGISPMTTDALDRYLKEPGRVQTISNGAAISKIHEVEAVLRESVVPATCRLMLMQVAGFREAKDQDCVIRALKNLPSDVHAVFVGDGVRREICEKLADELGVRERAHFLGVRSDVPALLKSADVVVMSSLWEGFGLAAVEGMAAGKPVVASDVPGLAEVVGGAGILFSKGDEKALAGIISKLASDKEFYEKTATACVHRSRDFDIRKTAEAYLAVYENRVI